MKIENLIWRIMVTLILALGMNTSVLKASFLIEIDNSAKPAKRRENPIQILPENEENLTTPTHKDLNKQEVSFSLWDLPPEIMMYVLAFLSPHDWVGFRHACHLANQVAKADHFDYQLKLHYGLHVGYIEPSERSIVIKYSLNGQDWFLHAPVSVNGALITGVEKLSLAKYNRRHYAAILQKSDQKSVLKIISCKNGTSWKVVSEIESGPLLDLQLVPFQGKLWLSYIPSATETITLASLKEGHRIDQEEKIKVPFPKAKKLSLTTFKDRLYLAYAIAHDSPGDIYIASSNNGYNWLQTDVRKTSWETHDCLQLIPYKNKLRLVHILAHRQAIKIGSFVDESGWLFDCQYPTPQLIEHLKLQAFQNRLFIISWGEANSSIIFESRDGVNWESSRRLEIMKESDLMERKAVLSSFEENNVKPEE